MTHISELKKETAAGSSFNTYNIYCFYILL